MHTIEQSGSDPAVLCIHGYRQSSYFWTPTVQRLSASGVHALAVDLPGFGASAAESGPYTVEGFADGLAALLDTKKLDVVDVLGGSMGGVVAQHFALRHPGRLRRLLLVATGAYTENSEKALERLKLLEQAPLPESAMDGVARGFFHTPPPEAVLAEIRRIAFQASHQATLDAARSNAANDTLERLGNIRAPTLIVQGRHDAGRTPEHGAEMAKRIPEASLEVLPNSGHTPQLEEPEAFHALALPFLLAGR